MHPGILCSWCVAISVNKAHGTARKALMPCASTSRSCTRGSATILREWLQKTTTCRLKPSMMLHSVYRCNTQKSISHEFQCQHHYTIACKIINPSCKPFPSTCHGQNPQYQRRSSASLLYARVSQQAVQQWHRTGIACDRYQQPPRQPFI